jgi:hypothetical protein
VRTRLGQVLVYAGRLDEAADQFSRAADGAEPDEAAELRRLEIEQRLRSGHRDVAMAGVHQLLGAVGCRLPASRVAIVAALVAHAAAARIAPWLRRRGARAALTPALDRRMRVLASLSLGMAFIDPVLGRLLYLRLQRDAFAAGLEQHLGMAAALGVGYLGSTAPVPPSALEAARRRGLALAAELDDPILEGWVLGGSGLASYFSGHWRDAHDQLTRGREVLQGRSGDVRWLLDIGEIYATAALWSLGDTAELVRVLPELLRDAQERGDRLAARRLRTWRSNAAWLVLDRADEAEYQIEATAPASDHEEIQLRHFYELLARAQIDLYRREGRTAYSLVKACWPELERALLLRVRPLRIEAWFLRGRCAVAAPGDPRSRHRDARRASRALERDAAPHASGYAAALRATVCYQQGRLDQACAELRRAAALFTGADMALFAAAAHVRLGSLVGGSEGAALAVEAATAMTRGAVVDPIAMTDLLLPGWSSS